MRFCIVSMTLAVVSVPCANAFATDTAPANERHLSQLVESIVRAAVPTTFENRKQWDIRQEVISGVKVKTDGLNVRISKREKSVRHGFWRRYSVTLVDPQETLRIRISDVEPLGGGRWRYIVTADARANVVARFEHWNLGVKLLNTSSEAEASFRMRAACTLDVHVEEGNGGPFVVFDPDVTTVDLSLPNLDVKKLGELRGDAATELGDALEEVAEDLLKTQEEVVRKQARKEIVKHKDDLRIPLGDFLTSRWASLWLLQ